MFALPPRVFPPLLLSPPRDVCLSPYERLAASDALPASRLSRCSHASLSLIVIGVTLAGCALDEGPGQFGVDPGRYELYHCNDLAARMKKLQERENELRSLIGKASEGGGGARTTRRC